MRIAHLSDLHVLALDGVSRTRFLNKRFTGLVNLRMKREHKHRPGHVRSALREVARAKVDHVILTGDLTNLALEQEFDAVNRMLGEELGLAARDVTIDTATPELYTSGSLRSQRFTRAFAPYMESDLPDLAAEIGLGRFPIVKLRGPLAIIGLSSAVPRPPLVASGELGDGQLAALDRILAHEEVRSRTAIIALHHPIHNPESKTKTWVEGLRDAHLLARSIDALPRGLLLHGHLHRRMQREVVTTAGKLLSVGATSASLHHEDEHRMAGFNVYEFDDAGELTDVSAQVFQPAETTFRHGTVPVLTAYPGK